MFEVRIFNLKGFLQTVDCCIGPVYLLCPDGTKTDVNKNESLQQELWRQFLDNKRYLRLRLDVPQVRDYMSVVCFSLGNF